MQGEPKTKILALTFGLVLLYIALAMYFAPRIQEHPLPIWFPYFGPSYILATMIVVMVFTGLGRQRHWRASVQILAS
jgi:uncharacterized membrane protein YfcA